MGFTLLSNFLFCVGIIALALLHLRALVALSRLEMRTIQLIREPGHPGRAHRPVRPRGLPRPRQPTSEGSAVAQLHHPEPACPGCPAGGRAGPVFNLCGHVGIDSAFTGTRRTRSRGCGPASTIRSSCPEVHLRQRHFLVGLAVVMSDNQSFRWPSSTRWGPGPGATSSTWAAIRASSNSSA